MLVVVQRLVPAKQCREAGVQAWVICLSLPWQLLAICLDVTAGLIYGTAFSQFVSQLVWTTNLQLRSLLLASLLAAAGVVSGHRQADIWENPANHLLDGQESPSGEARGCRHVPRQSCTEHDGPSGNYVNLGMNLFVHSRMPARVFPGVFPFFGTFLCDLEVGGSGSSDGSELLDETHVNEDHDEQATVYDALTQAFEALFGSGAADFGDGTWDDGGDSAVCHRTSYDETSYNDVPGGCTGSAHAEDIMSGGDVWLVTTCDWLGPVTFGSDPFSCLLEEVSTDQERADDCIQALFAQPPEVQVCGADGGRDGIFFGQGGGDGGVGVPYPVPEECLASDAFPAAYVTSFLGTSAGIASPRLLDPNCTTAGLPACIVSGEPDPSLSAHPYLAGWIDWSAESGNGIAFGSGFGPGICVVNAGNKCGEDVICIVNLDVCDRGAICGVNLAMCNNTATCGLNLGFCDTNATCGVNNGNCAERAVCGLNWDTCETRAVCGINFNAACTEDGICGGNIGDGLGGGNCTQSTICGINLFAYCDGGICGVNTGVTAPAACGGGVCGANLEGASCQGGICGVNLGTCKSSICPVNTGTCGRLLPRRTRPRVPVGAAPAREEPATSP